ncbi:hypothetical protein MHYP_G00031830 [Metynnis hypsauchen]
MKFRKRRGRCVFAASPGRKVLERLAAFRGAALCLGTRSSLSSPVGGYMGGARSGHKMSGSSCCIYLWLLPVVNVMQTKMAPDSFWTAQIRVPDTNGVSKKLWLPTKINLTPRLCGHGGKRASPFSIVKNMSRTRLNVMGAPSTVSIFEDSCLVQMWLQRSTVHRLERPWCSTTSSWPTQWPYYIL